MSETTAEETPAAEPVDEQLGDAGKRALAALRSENKELKARLKALEGADAGTGDPAGDSDSPSDGTSDSATDADSDASAMPADNVKPTPLRFQGTADNGARTPPAHLRQLSRSDLVGMSPRAIEAARRNGQLRDLLSGK